MSKKLKPPLEKHVERDIMRALETMGFDVSKTSQPRPSMVRIGIPDLYARHPRWGIRLWIEVKRPGIGRLSAAQRHWIEVEREAGGLAIVADSVADLLDHLRAMGAPV